MAIERVQFGTGLKICPKFFGPYLITSIKGFDRHKVKKEGSHEGPNVTECSVDKMKYWPQNDTNNSLLVSEDSDEDVEEVDGDQNILISSINDP